MENQLWCVCGNGRDASAEHTGILQVLPALPSAWKKGSITGLRAVNKFGVDIHWDSDRIGLKIVSDAGKDCVISCADIKTAVIKDQRNNKDVKFTVTNDGQIKFPTDVHGIYTIDLLRK